MESSFAKKAKENMTMRKKKEDRPYFDENRDYIAEAEAKKAKNSPFNREVVEKEKIVMRTLRKQFLRYREAEIVYSLEHKKILEMADQCGAIYRRDGTVLINRDIFDEYLEQFHQPAGMYQTNGNREKKALEQRED